MLRWMTLLFIVCSTAAFADDTKKVAPSRDPEMQRELLRRVKEDQEARTALIDWMKENGSAHDGAAMSPDKRAEFEKRSERVGKADTANTKWLTEVIEKHGWPTITLVGKDGAQAAWLLVQHADADPKFQRKCLDLMAKLPKTEISQTNLAYLTDRVLLAEGKKQIYGTQYTSSGGEWKPRPLLDEANVDKRRAEVGLPPLAEYVKQLKKTYGDAQKKN